MREGIFRGGVDPGNRSTGRDVCGTRFPASVEDGSGVGNERQQHCHPGGDDCRHPGNAEVEPLPVVHAHGMSSTFVIKMLALPRSLLSDRHQECQHETLQMPFYFNILLACKTTLRERFPSGHAGG